MGKREDEQNGFSTWAFISGLISFLTVAFLIFLFIRQRCVVKKDVVEVKPKLKRIGGLNVRQQKVLDLLKEKKNITVEDILSNIKGVSERTLRRDMNKLESLGVSKKQGTTKGSKYIYLG
jgi:predicted HTH transcriptional regulator